MRVITHVRRSLTKPAAASGSSLSLFSFMKTFARCYIAGLPLVPRTPGVAVKASLCCMRTIARAMATPDRTILPRDEFDSLYLSPARQRRFNEVRRGCGLEA
jgi:hypothetical protein